jgi:hypothetical protein
MKKIVTSNITDQARLPLLKRTLEFMRENDAETSTASLYAMLGNNSDSVPIVLWGCEPTITTASLTGDTLTITEGAILYDGEIYQVAAGSTVFTAGQVHTLAIVATNQTGEPTKYTDDSEHITNINYTIAVSHGLTGSGICDWGNRLKMNSNFKQYTVGATLEIFSAFTPSNATLTDFSITATKRGDIVNMNGAFKLTTTGSFAYIDATLIDPLRWKTGDTIMYPRACHITNITDGTYFTALVSNNIGGYGKNKFNVVLNVAIPTGKDLVCFIDFSYQADNLL